MAAAQAVFETCELLENIVIYVPAHQIRSLKVVAKFWSHLIWSSSAIRKAQCLTPGSFWVWSGGHIPIYESEYEPRMRVHQGLFAPYTLVRDQEPWCIKESVRLSARDAYNLAPYRKEYATLPRCQCLYMELASQTEIQCTVYNKNGIKISDIIETRVSLIHAYRLSTQGHGQAWVTFGSSMFDEFVEAKVRVAERWDGMAESKRV